MNKLFGGLVSAACLASALALPAPGSAQAAEVKEKPRMYTYVADWTMPRSRWTEMEKASTMNQKLFDQAVASGALVGYGNDTALVHTTEGATHDNWWSAMSMAGLFNMLDEVYKSGSAVAPIFAAATKHSDSVYESRFYNWRAGSYTGAYTHSGSYKLKADAPNDAVETLSKTAIVPLLERLLADGTLIEYEIDEQAIHTESPSVFYIVYITKSADGLDKVHAAVTEMFKASPLTGPAFGSMVDFTDHRDYLSRTTAVYK
jgi:hypothetical protein